MVLRLQLANGEVKEYDTFYSQGGGESTPEYWETKCGLKRYERPPSFGGCDHLDCALAVVGRSSLVGLVFNIIILEVLAAFYISILVLGSVPFNPIFYGLIFGVIALAVGLVSGSVWCSNSKSSRELIEFKGYGTVNGMAAELKRTY